MGSKPKLASMPKFLIFAFFLLWSGSLAAQDARLAEQYFRDGEYEKASVLYEKLYKDATRSNFYFNRYVDCLLALEQYDACEKVIKKQIKKEPDNVNFYVTYGKLFERQYNDEAAKEQYQKAIGKLPKNRGDIIKLANTFIGLTKFDLAIDTYEAGGKLLKDEYVFAFNLGDLYRRKGDVPNMIKNYLRSLEESPNRLNSLKTQFQRFLNPEDYQEVKVQLYERIQENEEAVHYVELLTWVFVQQKDYKNAFRQARALDRRFKENGGRIYRLAEIAANDRAYDAAIEAYQYIVEKKGPQSSYYIDAKRQSLRAKRSKLVEGFEYTDADLVLLEQQYETFLDEFGRSKLTAEIIFELAELEAFYLNNLDKAIQLLTEMIAFPNVNRVVQAEGKLNLADFYLMKGEIWEATLLYSQVDKAFKDDIMGHEARFRNARLSYFANDFQWAQAQFDVLKASTSKLIANDALDMSIFIMDNLGLDTTTAPLQLFAQAELLVFQNQFEQAFTKLDTLVEAYPEHALEDDVLYLKSRINFKKRNYEQTASLLNKIVEEYPEDIWADNALFQLAELYEQQLGDKEKAQALYEKMFIDYSGSSFAVEARKRYRILRGDTIQ